MSQYQVSNDMAGTKQATTTTYKTLTEVYAVTAALRRGRLVDMTVGTEGTPADNSYQFDVSRMGTSAGTVTAATPSPIDLADVACSSVAGVNATGESTIGVQLLYIPLNQRASYRWVARDEREALVWPATNFAGLACRAKSAVGTVVCGASLIFDE